MRQSTSLNEAEIQAFTDQAFFTKPQTQKGRMPFVAAMWVIAGGYYGHCFNDWHFYEFDMITYRSKSLIRRLSIGDMTQ